MRNAVTLSAVLLVAAYAVATLPAFSATATPPSSADVPAFNVESRNVDAPVTYCFTVDVERPQGAFDRSDGPGPGAGSETAQSKPPPIEPQTIRFATFDLDHVRLTVLDAAGAETKETIVAEREPDGQLHPNLKRGSHWALPLALYDRMIVLADVASEPVYPGKPITAKLAPIAGSDEIDGTIATHAGKETHLVYDATGSVTPSRELLSPGGSPPGDGGGGVGGERGGGTGGREGRGRRGPDGQNQPRKADATVHVDAVFRNASLEHAESTESLAFGSAGIVSKQTWSVVRVP